ncbi:hypothetical protein LAUMK7_03005 [Mycobacterium kansasii]|uniref:Uncharacterized protein n=1 Tax=Mycobacterium kansasii TaxID=1768 RepID=A0A653F6E8_MYCKA|nr:hypothetical protein MKANGN_15760 [Mycobacterium kansasii]VAZ60589.1 hypothetical protein LAUMK22_02397 [Mycobacterium kansasii]VAZ66909.1 hypothetical protein LAUMK40_03047 [Mycobacterium kansasii]VAZ75688.1 hypothetical protein LAUMK7_03005 [Mycobacterium kansasii]VTP05327.1 hypothetical protein BIN_B_05169 [Mycobacterium kansasii]
MERKFWVCSIERGHGKLLWPATEQCLGPSPLGHPRTTTHRHRHLDRTDLPPPAPPSRPIRPRNRNCHLFLQQTQIPCLARVRASNTNSCDSRSARRGSQRSSRRRRASGSQCRPGCRPDGQAAARGQQKFVPFGRRTVGGPGAIAMVECSDNSLPGGPTSARYTLFRDTGTLESPSPLFTTHTTSGPPTALDRAPRRLLGLDRTASPVARSLAATLKATPLP